MVAKMRMVISSAVTPPVSAPAAKPWRRRSRLGASGSSRPGVRHAAPAPAAVGAANTATTTTRMSQGFPVRAAAYQVRPAATPAPAPKAKVALAILDPRAVIAKIPAA